MSHEFSITDELELAGSPEEVWAAIASGPGMDAWFLGRHDVVPGLGGTVHSDFAGGAIPASTITGWEPARRLATTSSVAPDGRFLANEYLVAGRDDGTSVLRIVTSGFLPGDDWETEFEAMQAGGCVFRAALAEYIDHFAGQKATPLTVFGPPVTDWKIAWATMDDALGLTSLERGTPARIVLPDQPGQADQKVIDGVLYASNDQSRSIRAGDAIYRFLQGFSGAMVICHVTFSGTDDPATGLDENAWQTWLNTLYA